MTTEQKFKAAVNVIRNLPPKGSVQPSHHVLLKFYAYYKQATEGPNTCPKPAFWEIVKKAKWDAWSKLGDMDREIAMQHYVDEFKKIVEATANANTDKYDKSEVDSFYASIPLSDLELVVGSDFLRSRSNSPTAELNGSVVGDNTDLTEYENENTVTNRYGIDVESNYVQFFNGTATAYTNGSVRSDEDEDDECFLDTIENSDQGSTKARFGADKTPLRLRARAPYPNDVRGLADDDGNNGGRSMVERETSLHLTKVIVRLHKDLEKVVRSVDLIEQRIGQLQGKMEQNTIYPHILPSPLISFALLFAWPVILQLLIFWLRRRK